MRRCSCSAGISKPHATVALSGECADEIFGGYPWYRDPTVRERYGFPWAQSTAYRASFIKPGVLGGIDPAAFVDERYRATLAQTSVRPGLPAAEQRMRQMMNLISNGSCRRCWTARTA